MRLQEAFDEVCTEAKQASGFYVVLMERIPYYGGPEEGGWWGCDTKIAAYQYFPTHEQAEAARIEVEKLAAKLESEAKAQYGQQCLNETKWLDARGLEDNFLSEVDGNHEFFVIVSEGLPLESTGSRNYS